MCVVSMVGDYYNDKWQQPWIQPQPILPPQKQPKSFPPERPIIPISVEDIVKSANPTIYKEYVTKEDFDALKKEVLEMKELLKRALDYDKRNNEPNCEMEEKVALLKKVAEFVGVTLEDIFPNK